ncbi:MAG: YfhO family protein [Flavobacteriaceae bacterium]|nr:YfhO family protein [Flavobacteriaceae bacterium]
MKLKPYLPYFTALVTFAVVALAYFYPVLEGKEILQSDIVQFKGMSHEVVKFRAQYNSEPYWTDAAFGGMPTYQLSAYYPYNYIQKLDKLIRFLPRPADYLFGYFLGFFILLMVLKVEWKLAVFGSLAFGFSTYFIIILGVGHNAKAHAIAYMPLVIAGVLLIFKNNLFKGFVLTAFATALELSANHIQMTYYLFFVLLIIGGVYLQDAYKSKALASYFKKVGFLCLAGILALGLNATPLMATSQYAKHSTRGKSALTITPDGKTKPITQGLDSKYITEYSYGILETFNLLVPRFMGGGSHESLDNNSNTYRFLKNKVNASQAKQFTQFAPLYWGNQPIVAAPAYIGAVIIFLALLGFFLLKNKQRTWIIGAIMLAILLSWGKNFNFLTEFFIKYVPLYNKFRAVSSIQVIVELCMPLLAILGLVQFLSDKTARALKIKSLKSTSLIVGGVLLVFVFFGKNLFSFEGVNDTYYARLLKGLDVALVADRKEAFFDDSLRSLLLILPTFLILWFNIKQKITNKKTVLFLGLLMVADLVFVDINYVNDNNFVTANAVERPIQKTDVDRQILQDKTHYRVANFIGGVANAMNDGKTSYFHNSIGGYHAAKPGRYQELFDYQIAKNNIEVLNMLNTKYFIFDKDGTKALQINPGANGNAWFVSHLKIVTTANEEIKALDSLDTKNRAVFNNADFENHFESGVVPTYTIDSTASISLKSYEANDLKYTSKNTHDGFAVFSEMYYKEGWHAYIDGKLTPIYRVNYVLRALEIPKGDHKIEFKFEPQVIHRGSLITGISYLLLIGIILGWYFYDKKKQH